MSRLLAISPLAGIAGGEVILLRLAPLLARRGWDVRIAVPGRGALADAARDAGITVSRLPLGPPERRTSASYLGAALAPLQVSRADVVLLNGLSTQRVLPALRLTRRPALLHVNNPLERAPRAWRRMGFWEAVRYVWVDSRWSAEQCAAAGAPPDRIRVISPPAWGAGEDLGQPPRSLHGQRVGFVGQLEPRKGALELVRAACIFLAGRDQATLEIVGAPPAGQELYAERVRAEADASAVASRIGFHGFVPGIAAEIARFDLLVVPSLAEPFGTVAAEAAAAGVPVVASRVGGLVEVVDNGGLLVPPGQPQALAAAVGELLDDPARRRALGEAALMGATRFDPERFAECMDALLSAPIMERG